MAESSDVDIDEVELELERQVQAEEAELELRRETSGGFGSMSQSGERGSDAGGEKAPAAPPAAPRSEPPLAPGGPPPADSGGEARVAIQDRQRRVESGEKFKELMYSFNSFTAVFWPVSLTVLLAGLAIVYVNDGANGDGGGGLLTLPQVRDESAASTGGEKAEAAILNALVIVGIFGGITFLMVALYYYNMIRVLVGWLLVSTGLLLYFTTQLLVSTAFVVYLVPFDTITYNLFFWNYAACGLLAVFYQKGLPTKATQGYLVGVSVVMAWLLVKFLPEWTSWALLVLLACYDLCAVLTPVGPLKCLIEIAGSKDVGMPGLLYEARVQDHSGGDSEASVDTGSRRSNGSGAGVAGPLGMFVFMAERSQPPGYVGLDSDDDVDAEGGAPPRSPPPMPTQAQLAQQQQQQQQQQQYYQEEYTEREDIKLGLGDFVFYSVLIGRAALNGISTFVATYLIVVAGLAATLFLLAVYHKALPALPFSIFLGVIFYFSTDLLVVPLANALVVNYQTM